MRRMNWRRVAIMGFAATLGVWALFAIVPGFERVSPNISIFTEVALSFGAVRKEPSAENPLPEMR